MAKCNFYFSSCGLMLLLQLLLTLNCRTSAGLPVNTDRCARCGVLFKNLLLNIKGLLKSDDLCFGILSDKVVLRSEADTLMACAPTLAQNSSCTMKRNSPFSESECLQNIMKDLVYYEAAIQSYLNSALRSPKEEAALLSPTLGIIESLKNCFLMPTEENKSEKDAAQTWGSDTYNNRQEMCKMMRGFYVRAITINRAMGYIAAGDHRK